MRGSQRSQRVLSSRSEPHVDAPVVHGRTLSLGKAAVYDPIDQLHRRVMLDLKRFGEIPDRRRLCSSVTAYRYQELVLFGRESRLAGCVLAEAVKSAESGAKGGERLKILIREWCF